MEVLHTETGGIDTDKRKVTRREAVRLLHAKAVQVCPSAMGIGHAYAHGYVEVDNVAYEKQVWVRYSYKISKGLWTAWCDLPATYDGPSDHNYDRWHFITENVELYSPRGTVEYRFAAFCVVAGHTSWDNNGGNNYVVGVGENTLLPRVLLGHDQVILNNASTALQNGKVIFDGSVTVRVHSKSPRVTVIYTCDAWVTIREISVSYAFSIHGYSMEHWVFKAVLDSEVSEIRFAIAYATEEGTFWDNRFGADYSVAVPGKVLA